MHCIFQFLMFCLPTGPFFSLVTVFPLQVLVRVQQIVVRFCRDFSAGFLSLHAIHISCTHYLRCHKHKLKPASFLSERAMFLYSFIIYVASLSGIVLACLSLIEDTSCFTAFVHYQCWADQLVY